MFTRQHYKAIAEILKKANKAKELRYAGSVAHRFADCFQTENSRFNRQKFLDACDYYK